MSTRHVHVPGQQCQCNSASALMAENLDELKFKKSICGAAVDGDVARVRELLRRDPVRNLHTDGVNDTSGYTPLHYAARGGNVEVVKALLEHGKSYLFLLNCVETPLPLIVSLS
jgi:ankyrin repeat protein